VRKSMSGARKRTPRFSLTSVCALYPGNSSKQTHEAVRMWLAQSQALKIDQQHMKMALCAHCAPCTTLPPASGRPRPPSCGSPASAQPLSQHPTQRLSAAQPTARAAPCRRKLQNMCRASGGWRTLGKEVCLGQRWPLVRNHLRSPRTRFVSDALYLLSSTSMLLSSDTRLSKRHLHNCRQAAWLG